MIPNVKKDSDFIEFTGGLDIVSPQVSIPKGFVRDSINVEEDINGGYASLKGYERYDGRPAPSSAIYSILAFTAQGTVTIGDTITGAVSGASGVVIAFADNAFVLTKVSGTFQAEATTSGGATVVGPATGSAASKELGAQYLNLAADEYRADITAVPGTGRVLGVFYYGGVVYAFRNKVTTGVGLYASSSIGWQAVDLGYQVEFSNANTSVEEGDTLTQGGVTATINRVVVEDGTLLSGTNTGRLILSAPSGGNFAAGAATSDGGGSVILSGAEAAIEIPNQNGRYEVVIANFTGWRGTKRVYGCDGVNDAFEFDGSIYVPIRVGAGIYPSHVIEHQHHLFMAYLSSVFNSGIGNPYNWTSTAGAAEMAMGDDVTGFMTQPGTSTTAALLVSCRNRKRLIYGTISANWQVDKYDENSGAVKYSVQKIGRTYVLDDRGVTDLVSAQEFGNFQESVISKRVKTWFSSKRNILTDSHVARDKQQYRLFFSDGSAAYWTINDKKASMMPVQFPNPVMCSVSAEEDGGGAEVIFFGSDNGMVYQMERGTSFDGEPIYWSMDLVFNFSRMYRVRKRYRRATFELFGEAYSVFRSGYTLSYGSTNSVQPDDTVNEIDLSVPEWDVFTFDEFTWDGLNLFPLSLDASGYGDNISLRFSGNSDYYGRLRFSGAFIEYSPLRMSR